MSARGFERLCFIDIETTGLDPSSDAVLEVGLVFVVDGEVVERAQWLIKSPKPVPAFITALTGLSGDEGRSSFAEIEPELRTAITGWTLVAHNAEFERSFLRETLAQSAVLDSWAVAMLLYPELEGHSLDALVRWLGVGRAARHRALDDAEDTFRMLKALCGRLSSAEVHRARGLTAHLDVAVPDQGALATLFAAIEPADTEPDGSSVLTEPPPPWATELERLLSRPGAHAFEVEDGELFEPVWAIAERLGIDAVAVGPRTFRREARRRAALARHPVCRGALQRALPTMTAGVARTWLAAWLPVTKTAEFEALGPALARRSPELVEAFAAARVCNCSNDDCAVRATRRLARPVLITHAHALDWLERGHRARLFVLEAERLADAERSRGRIELDLAPFADAGLEVDAVNDALAALAVGPVLLRQRLDGGWTRLRVAMESLAANVRALPVSHQRAAWLQRLVDVMAPPRPGEETVVRSDEVSGRRSLVRGPVRAAQQVARRLRPGHVLLSNERGGLDWAKQGAWVFPTTRFVGRAEWVTAPLSLDALPDVLRSLGEALVVTPEPLPSVAEACSRAGLDVSLDQERPARVKLVRWRRDQPPSTNLPCVFYGVREWRRAILSAQSPRIVLAGPRGIDAHAFAAACRGLKTLPWAG